MTRRTWSWGLLVLTASVSVSSPVLAAGVVALVPVVVGAGQEPPPDLMASLAKGMEEAGLGWTVAHGAGLRARMQAAASPALAEEAYTRLSAKLDEASRRLTDGQAGEDVIAALEALREEMRAAAKSGPFGARDYELAYRTNALLVAALLGQNQAEKAKTVAEEAALMFPGRKPADVPNLTEAAAQLLAEPPGTGGKLKVTTLPAGCEVAVNGAPVGRAPIELPVLPDAVYHVQAKCSTGSGGAHQSRERRIVMAEAAASREEVIDTELERRFMEEGGQRLRFASSLERRQQEEASARRVVAATGVDLVVLASIGELSGSDWLNARLYLKSGYLNRQGLVRLEAPRAVALGRYLATGKEVPGVLKPEEAGALVASTKSGPPPARAVDPWYTDVVGWALTGTGLLGISLGLWADHRSDALVAEADDIRGDSARQDALYRKAQERRFYSTIGLVGGGLLTATGLVLLAVPEYRSNETEMLVLSPLPGGGMIGWSGRF